MQIARCSFAVLLPIALVATGCGSSSTESTSTEDALQTEEAVTEEAAKGCPLSDISCYHYYAGHVYKSSQACHTAGGSITDGVYGYRCVAEQPSGNLTLWIWSPSCPRGETFQQCKVK